MSNTLFRNFEKRRFDRKQLYYYLKVNHEETGDLAGYLGDISPEGLMVFSKESVELKKIFKLRIDLEQEFEIKDNLVLEAESIWCEKDANPEFFVIGLRLLNMDQARIDIISYLIKKYGFFE